MEPEAIASAACVKVNQLDRMTAVGYNRQARFLPGLKTTFDDEGFAGATHLLCEQGSVVRAPLSQ